MAGVLGEKVLDSLDMFGVARAFPEQVEQAAARSAVVEGLPPADAIDNVLVLGMGGSGIAGDVLAAIAAPFVSVPMLVAKGYAPPSFVGPGTLCFAVSYSGNTEETVEAAQAAAGSASSRRRGRRPTSSFPTSSCRGRGSAPSPCPCCRWSSGSASSPAHR